MARSSSTPLTLVTGPLGSGKTTLLRFILDAVPRKIAILMNEFGEIGIDARVVEGKSVKVAELAGGCVCCSLVGEFEAAVAEICGTVDPDLIVVETTGLAEPDALIVDIQDALPQVRLDGVVTVADADGMVQFPQLGRTTRVQFESADLILLNKIDLVSEEDLGEAAARLRERNNTAAILPVRRCRVDPDLIFGIAKRDREARPARHVHQPEYDSIAYETDAILARKAFERFADRLDREVVRAKGFVRFADGGYLFNFVAGRWEMEPFPEARTALVLIGKGLAAREREIGEALDGCRRT